MGKMTDRITSMRTPPEMMKRLREAIDLSTCEDCGSVSLWSALLLFLGVRKMVDNHPSGSYRSPWVSGDDEAGMQTLMKKMIDGDWDLRA